MEDKLFTSRGVIARLDISAPPRKSQKLDSELAGGDASPRRGRHQRRRRTRARRARARCLRPVDPFHHFIHLTLEPQAAAFFSVGTSADLVILKSGFSSRLLLDYQT